MCLSSTALQCVQVSKLEHVTFRAILWHLIFARSIKNELDIARWSNILFMLLKFDMTSHVTGKSL